MNTLKIVSVLLNVIYIIGALAGLCWIPQQPDPTQWWGYMYGYMFAGVPLMLFADVLQGLRGGYQYSLWLMVGVVLFHKPVTMWTVICTGITIFAAALTLVVLMPYEKKASNATASTD